MKLPTYRNWSEIPENLKTKTALGKMGLKPAKEQKPAAVKTHWHYSRPNYYLYEVSQAVPKRKMSTAQTAALANARKKACTTSCCNRDYGSPNWEYEGGMCLACYCAWEENKHQSFLEESRQEAIEWAKGALVDHQAVILDSETTGLDGEIVEIAVITMQGETLLNTLVYNHNIPIDATAIHGISTQDVLNAPQWPDVYKKLKAIFTHASKVIIYNAEFDMGRLHHMRYVHKTDPLPDVKTECAMEYYAQYYGQWSDYHESFTWQPLGGGHRALGDCVATLDLIKGMGNNGDMSND